MIKLEKSGLSIFHKRVKRCIERLVSFRKYLYNCRSDESFTSIDWYKSIMNEIEESVALISQYNLFEVKDLIKVKPAYKDEKMPSFTLEEVAVHLNSILREIRDVDSYLDLYLKPNLSDVEKGRIDMLRKDFDTLDIGEIVKKNLDIALMEAESGHELACGIISARVIVDRLEKIKGENDEERLAKLVELKIINSTESSKFSSRAFLDASRAARNAINHQISWFPNGAESLSLLSSAFRMAEWVSRYEKEKGDKT